MDRIERRKLGTQAMFFKHTTAAFISQLECVDHFDTAFFTGEQQVQAQCFMEQGFEHLEALQKVLVWAISAPGTAFEWSEEDGMTEIDLSAMSESKAMDQLLAAAYFVLESGELVRRIYDVEHYVTTQLVKDLEIGQAAAA